MKCDAGPTERRVPGLWPPLARLLRSVCIIFNLARFFNHNFSTRRDETARGNAVCEDRRRRNGEKGGLHVQAAFFRLRGSDQ